MLQFAMLFERRPSAQESGLLRVWNRCFSSSQNEKTKTKTPLEADEKTPTQTETETSSPPIADVVSRLFWDAEFAVGG